MMTFSLFLLWIGASGLLVYEACTVEDSAAPLVSLLVFNAIMLPMMLFCEGYAPQQLEVGHSKIVILRRYNSVVIPREDICRVERLPDDALRFAVRTCGVGGLFGYFGKYYSRKIGSFSLYATRLDNLYLVRRRDGKLIVFSCADPDKMEGWLSSKNEIG